jgi:hypothetical protein
MSNFEFILSFLLNEDLSILMLIIELFEEVLWFGPRIRRTTIVNYVEETDFRSFNGLLPRDRFGWSIFLDWRHFIQ